MTELDPFAAVPSPPRPRVPAVLLAGTLLLSGCGRGEVIPDAAGADAVPREVRGPIDGALADRGEALFRDLGCLACHRMEERLVGPALEGVTSRRSYPWFHHMVTNPDSMLRNDSTARSLLAEYLTPMPGQDVAPAEARALFEHFRRSDGTRRASADDPASPALEEGS